MTQEDVQTVWEQLQKDCKPLWAKANKEPGDIKKLQQFVCLSVYFLIPPRRLIDYTHFKVKNENKETDNYMEKGHFVFNAYKTADKYGQQKVKIPRQLQLIITKWSKLGLSDYLLFNRKGKPMSQPFLTTFINGIFGKRVSVDILRHSFITEKVLANTPALTELQQVASDMGQSVAEQQLYRRIDAKELSHGV